VFINGFESFELIKNLISRLSTEGKPQEDFLIANINEWERSFQYKEMIKAQKYYKNESDILKRERYSLNRKGVKEPNHVLSNKKLNHPFLRKLVRQKVNYLLAKEFSIQADNDKLQEKLSEILTDEFYKLIKNVGTHAIVNGIAWVQAYYNEEGKVDYKRIPSDEVIPFWSDSDHTKLDAVIRQYKMTVYLPEGGKKTVQKIEYWTRLGVWYYVVDGMSLKQDPDAEVGKRGHFKIIDRHTNDAGEEVETVDEALWDKIPFVPFKYNADELSILALVKNLIDNYDEMTSDTANTIADIPDSIKIIKNYDGQDKDDFMVNLNTYRCAFVTGDGDIKSLETRIDINAIEGHLKRLRKDIYEAGSGVDTQDENMGNPSGTALKFRYIDLSNDANDMANEFKPAIKQLLWFKLVDEAINGVDLTEENYDIIFNTDMIINEAEVIKEAADSAGIISEETIIANHPWVTDAKQEKDRLEKERSWQVDNSDPYATNNKSVNGDDAE
jgi:SPP1 family phage portal protein